MKKRRRLADLYVRGTEASIDDGTGDPVKVWLQKLNEIERESIIRRANAAKARYSLDAEHDESEAFVGTLGSVRDFFGRDEMIDIVIAQDLAQARRVVEAKLIADEDGWGKDNKINDLLEAWTGDDENPGLAAAYAEDENDPQAVRVKGELEAFESDVERGVEDEKERLVQELSETSDNDLARSCAREVVKRQADEAFGKEWSRQQIFYCTREPDDHGKRYFGTLAEVDDLDDRIRSTLDRKCNALLVELPEGKDSPASPASSTSSEPTTVEEVPVDSGLEAVNT